LRRAALFRRLILLCGLFLVRRRFRNGYGHEPEDIGVVKTKMSFELGYGAGERLEDNYVISPPVVVQYLVCELPLRPLVESYYLSLMGCEGVVEPLLYLGELLFLNVWPDNV